MNELQHDWGAPGKRRLAGKLTIRKPAADLEGEGQTLQRPPQDRRQNLASIKSRKPKSC